MSSSSNDFGRGKMTPWEIKKATKLYHDMQSYLEFQGETYEKGFISWERIEDASESQLLEHADLHDYIAELRREVGESLGGFDPGHYEAMTAHEIAAQMYQFDAEWKRNENEDSQLDQTAQAAEESDLSDDKMQNGWQAGGSGQTWNDTASKWDGDHHGDDGDDDDKASQDGWQAGSAGQAWNHEGLGFDDEDAGNADWKNNENEDSQMDQIAEEDDLSGDNMQNGWQAGGSGQYWNDAASKWDEDHYGDDGDDDDKGWRDGWQAGGSGQYWNDTVSKCDEYHDDDNGWQDGWQADHEDLGSDDEKAVNFGDDDDDDEPFGIPSSDNDEPVGIPSFSSDDDEPFGIPSSDDDEPVGIPSFSRGDDEPLGIPSSDDDAPVVIPSFSSDDDEPFGIPSSDDDD